MSLFALTIWTFLGYRVLDWKWAWLILHMNPTLASGCSDRQAGIFFWKCLRGRSWNTSALESADWELRSQRCGWGLRPSAEGPSRQKCGGRARLLCLGWDTRAPSPQAFRAGFPGSAACRGWALGYLSLHNHVSQFLWCISSVSPYNFWVLFFCRTLANIVI